MLHDPILRQVRVGALALLHLIGAPLLVMSSALLAPGALADDPADVYSALFVVPGRDTSLLAQAQRDGLARVVIKASGDADADKTPEVSNALSEAQRFMLSYRYEETPLGELRLRLDYDEQAVQGLLERARLPLWTSRRPTVLVWLVVSDEAGRHFVSAVDTPQAQRALYDSFRQRGVPLQTPLYDLEDARALSVGAAWRQSSSALISASRRYRDTIILAGRVAELSSGRWTGDWQLLDNGRWLSQSAQGADFAAFTNAGAALVADTLARRYAVAFTESRDQRHRVTLRGVRSYGDYSAVLAALGGLEAVQRVVPESLLGDQVTLRIDADADLQQLSRIIELDERFVPSPEVFNSPGLNYEWIQ